MVSAPYTPGPTVGCSVPDPSLMILWPADVPLLGWQDQNSHAFPEPGRQLPQDGEMDDKQP